MLLVAALAVVVPSLPAVATAPDAPTVSKVSPDYGTTRGGTTVTLTGQHFDNVRAVRFGGKKAHFDRVSSTELTATTPAHPAGWVSVTVVTAAGSGVAKSGYRYATRAPRPVGAGYRVARADAPRGRLQLTVPRLTCRAHETSEIGAVVENVLRLRNGDRWAASVAFRCVDGVASYHTFLTCGGSGAAGPTPRPGNRVVLSYNKNSPTVEVDRSDTGVGVGCAGTEMHPANEPEVAFLVRTASHPPTSLQALTVHASAAGAPLSAAHPTRQTQPVNATTVLRPSAIGSDGRTFTARVHHR